MYWFMHMNVLKRKKNESKSKISKTHSARSSSTYLKLRSPPFIRILSETISKSDFLPMFVASITKYVDSVCTPLNRAESYMISSEHLLLYSQLALSLYSLYLLRVIIIAYLLWSMLCCITYNWTNGEAKIEACIAPGLKPVFDVNTSENRRRGH